MPSGSAARNRYSYRRGSASAGAFFRPSDMQRLRPVPPQIAGDQHSGEGDRGEHRGNDSDEKHHGETFDRPRTHEEHYHAGYGVGRIGLENRPTRLLVA